VKSKKISLIIYFIIGYCFTIPAQKTEVLKVKKEQTNFIFYQLGVKSDSVYPRKNNDFVLALPDSILFDTEIKVTNGRLSYDPRNKTFNFQFLPTMNYRHFLSNDEQLKKFSPEEIDVLKKSPKVFGDKYYITQVNGSNNNTTRQITIEFYNTKTGKVFLKNTFLFFSK
jgi:hypothetical protein